MLARNAQMSFDLKNGASWRIFVRRRQSLANNASTTAVLPRALLRLKVPMNTSCDKACGFDKTLYVSLTSNLTDRLCTKANLTIDDTDREIFGI
jgi:hypothetical protein